MEPTLRFPEFSDSYKTCELSELLTERHEIRLLSSDYPRLSFTIEEGVIDPENRKTNKRDFLIKDEANKKYLSTEVGDIIYNPANVVYGAIHRNSLKKGCVSPIYRIFYTNSNSSYIECIVRRESFIHQLTRRTEGTVVKLKTLKPESFLKMRVCVATSLEEQNKVADTFKLIDEIVSTITEEIRLWEEKKKGVMQKIFSQEVRFKDDDGNEYPEWESNSLNNLSRYIRNGYSYFADGDRTHRYKLTRIESISQGKINLDKLGSVEVIDKKYLLEDGDILYSHINSVQYIGNCAIYHDNYGAIYHGMNLLCIKPNKEMVIPDYLLLYLKSQIARKFAYSHAQRAVSQASIPSTDLGTLSVPVPSVEEQLDIVRCVSAIDEVLDIKKQKLDKWKTIKKGLLQQMFV